MKNPVPRVAAIHDLSGFGRSSLTIVSPILSTMGVQVCPLPTALLSTQTGGFENYAFFDLTHQMGEIIKHWKSLDIDFQAIYSGFLGSEKQVEIVSDFIVSFRGEDTIVLVDPVMGDDGATYAPIGPFLVSQMRQLVGKADIITPNFTEAMLLLDETYHEKTDLKAVKGYLRRLSEMGPRQVIITSVRTDDTPHISTVVAYDRDDGRFWKVDCSYIPAFYPGTGDIFASVVVGSILQGDSLPIALDRAVQFISVAIRATFGYKIPNREGVLLERVLGNLNIPIVAGSYELIE
ncbi:pyridoxamine kinase [Sediminispirochaeta bajacaliforniensis]|uniref:pyridoxamine kinase n=1 Tax=Sediminispirochaeta bajacaliforniensis TaxID=148 RepID=UPI0003749802|nr:pyridoxamine kinase [Sediminispirochaeta bajacaliforniensis]